MRQMLEDLCVNDAALRRNRLEAKLLARFGTRLRVERTVWPRGGAAAETVNFLVPFGRMTGHLVLGAHHDAVPGSPGANDNGAAVVQLFEAASRLLGQVEGGAQEPDVTFCFWDHEELYGSEVMGSRLYVHNHAGALPRRAVVFDVSGIGGLYVSSRDGAGLLPGLPARWTPPSDDRILAAAGVPTTLVCALPPAEMRVLHAPTWDTLHPPGDVPEAVQGETLEAGARLALELVRRHRAA